ncbi:MAG: type II secretion system F family protein [Chlamydiae bacterium]|nr:type II secretion system F family protein [Chlamydiota bacterium]
MPLYRYEALSLEGKKHKGMINADCLEMAKERLKKQKIIVTSLEKQKIKGAISNLSKASLLDFTRDIANLLSSGMPLYESLVIAEEKSLHSKEHPLFLDLCDQVKQGKKLSDVLAHYPKTFDSIYISMVRAAEESGSLADVFMQLTKVIARGEKLKKQMVGALTYPAFLCSFCLVVVVALFVFIIPSMQELLEGRRLHPLTECVLSISRFLSVYGNWIGLIFAVQALFLFLFFRSRKGKEACKKGLLYIPLVKKMVSQAVMIRFSRTLGILLKNSVALPTALRLSAKVMDHPTFSEVVERAEKKIMEGKKLSMELGQSKWFAPMVVKMIATAEEVGKIDDMLLHIAEIYEEDLEKSLQQFTSLLQPIMLLLLGLIVGVVLLSVLLPLTDVSSFL